MKDETFTIDNGLVVTIRATRTMATPYDMLGDYFEVTMSTADGTELERFMTSSVKVAEYRNRAV